MAVASFLYRRYLATKGLRRRAWGLLRRGLVSLASDPPCQMSAHGRMLAMPLSHALPDYLGQFPLYDSLPGRIGAFIRRAGRGLTCIDVGANVGDTIAAFRQDGSDLFLAVEPNPRFHAFLRENWPEGGPVTLVAEVCSSGAGEGAFEIRERVGTASLHPAETGVALRARSLDQILLDHPTFAEAEVLKVDTDGHDFQVLRGAAGLLARKRPFVLFECYAGGDEGFAREFLQTLELLRRSGYGHVLLYDNFGVLAGRFGLEDLSPLRGLLFYQLVGGVGYWDVLAVRDEDLGPFYEAEAAFFAGRLTSPEMRGAALEAAGATALG